MSDVLLSKENLHWRDLARSVADEFVRPAAARHDRSGEFPWAVQRAMGEAGLLKVWIPEEFGGAGGETPILNLVLVVEQIARACGSIGVGFAVNALGSFPILLGGTREQKEKYLPDIAAGRKMIAFCLSEKNAGSDAGALSSRATKDGDEYVLDGDKKWTTGGSVCDLYTYFGVTDPNSRSRRVSAFLVPKETEGFSVVKIEDKMGIRCIPVAVTRFDGCRVPAENLLGGREGAGFKHAMSTLDHARPGVAGQALGLAQGALDFSVHWATKRQQFGKPLAAHGQMQGKLADMSTKVAAARQLVYASALNIDRGAKNINLMAAQAKLFATDTAMEVTTEAVQVFGGYGYMKDYPVEKFMRDAKITQIYEGTNEVQRLVIARNLMKAAGQLDHLAPHCPLPDEG